MTDPAVFRVQHEVMGLGQAEFFRRMNQLVENCNTMATDQSTANYCTTTGAEDLIQSFKLKWATDGDPVAQALGAIGMCLGDVSDIARDGDRLAAMAWGY